MLTEFASPLLLLQVCVGYVELGTDSWIANMTNSVLSGQGRLLFVDASGIMFLGYLLLVIYFRSQFLSLCFHHQFSRTWG